MNSEELELSLRNEFESYLKNVLAEMRQDVSDFQEKFQAEFEKHKLQLDEVFKDFSERIEGDRQMDDAFKDSVVEHLRLSRDEGARITASAIAEAEDLEREKPAPPVPSVGFSEIRDAISDISSQDSQSAILKSLVNNAAQFTARGAFFIIKNEHFVGWRVFGNEAEMDEQSVREIFFPMANETLLSESVRSLSAVESSFGTYADDSLYLNKLEFGQPEKMYAIPLVARGRGVAVLYADYGTEGADVNVEAIETLVRVAGLTVELLAAAPSSKPQKDESQTATYAEETPETVEQTEAETTREYQAVGGYEFAQPEEITQESTQKFVTNQNSYVFEEPAEVTEAISEEFSYNPVVAETEPEVQEVGVHEAEEQFQPETGEIEEVETAKDYEFVSEPTSVEEVSPETEDEFTAEETAAAPAYSWSQPIESFEKPSESVFAREDENSFVAETEEVEETAETTHDFAITNSEYAFGTTQSYDAEPVAVEETEPVAETTQFTQWDSGAYKETAYDSSRFDTVETPVEPQFETNGNSESFVAAPVETVAEVVTAPPIKSRFSDRNVDLPIEVAEDERRSHNDARRFARLLVSEIKLYNEQKVKEGREGSDLYDRLREAIDRSREMYDKRVQPPVASKFDYFHYELISNLAEGDASKLGGSYPGATV